jgi:hypothetical protein
MKVHQREGERETEMVRTLRIGKHIFGVAQLFKHAGPMYKRENPNYSQDSGATARGDGRAGLPVGGPVPAQPNPPTAERCPPCHPNRYQIGRMVNTTFLQDRSIKKEAQ